MKQIIPAILTTDSVELEKKLHDVSGLVEWVQIDIMDGRFVDNRTIDLSDLQGISYDVSICIHLMVENPEDYFEECKNFGVRRVFFHAEASKDHKGLLQKLAKLGLEKGIAINPDTPIDEILAYKDILDAVLVMGVNPGFGGQEFMESSLEKIKELSLNLADSEIIVDGGINLKNIEEISAAGATGFVIGSAIFNADNITEAIEKFKDKI